MYVNLIAEEMGNHAWTKYAFENNTQPAGRHDAIMLEKWLNNQLKKFGELRTMDDFKSVQEVFSVCMHELIRQVSIHCVERGKLLGKLWVRYVDLFNCVATEYHTLKKQSNETLIKCE